MISQDRGFRTNSRLPGDRSGSREEKVRTENDLIRIRDFTEGKMEDCRLMEKVLRG